MSLAKLASLSLISLLAGCGFAPGYPSGSTPYSTPQPQVTGSQRSQYIWDKALEGMVMGGSLAGPYGAGGGLIIGLLAGLFTADGHYAQLNSQIQSEQAKDRQLEAKIEQEIERQRELEAQLVNSAGKPAPQNQAGPPQPPQKLTAPKVTTVALKEPSSAVASLTKKESGPNLLNSPFKNVEVRDINGDGIPDLWIYYNPLKPTEIVRQEEATQGDGRADTWSYFKDGKLVRRAVDTKGNGTADMVYYYENDKIAREERNENGDGRVTFRAVYQNGRLAKVEKDTTGQGKIDLWIYYDTTKNLEVVLKEERDLDGDEGVDLWSYYENGRLVRRDVSAVGLQLLSNQDRLRGSPADSKEPSWTEIAKDSKGHT